MVDELGVNLADGNPAFPLGICGEATLGFYKPLIDRLSGGLSDFPDWLEQKKANQFVLETTSLRVVSVVRLPRMRIRINLNLRKCPQAGLAKVTSGWRCDV
jgi:hypothetical protein